jgi:hypothetical protein
MRAWDNVDRYSEYDSEVGSNINNNIVMLQYELLTCRNESVAKRELDKLFVSSGTDKWADGLEGVQERLTQNLLRNNRDRLLGTSGVAPDDSVSV